MNIYDFWDAVIHQNAEQMKLFFHSDAVICWHNTNEKFTAEEFIEINCVYPGKWEGEVQRVEYINDLIITVVYIYSAENVNLSFHATSFFRMEQDKIRFVDEYWGEDGEPPNWRADKQIGKRIN